MDLQRNLRHNETSECSPGLAVIATDFEFASSDGCLQALTTKCDSGETMVPLHGINATSVGAPLDPDCLDENRRVMDAVEALPAFRVHSSGPRAARVLVLPNHSIYSSQTKLRDQLEISPAEEMEGRVGRISGSSGFARMANNTDFPPTEAVWSSVYDLPQLTNHSDEKPTELQQACSVDSIEESVRDFSSPRNWLQRWWSPDPRKALRQPLSGLNAYFWTGASPEEPHAIRDISATGVYLVTNERWRLGTVIRIFLTYTGDGTQHLEHSISVQSRAVRWGSDGVGLRFTPKDIRNPRGEQTHMVDGANRRELEEFLKEIGIGKS